MSIVPKTRPEFPELYSEVEACLGAAACCDALCKEKGPKQKDLDDFHKACTWLLSLAEREELLVKRPPHTPFLAEGARPEFTWKGSREFFLRLMHITPLHLVYAGIDTSETLQKEVSSRHEKKVGQYKQETLRAVKKIRGILSRRKLSKWKRNKLVRARDFFLEAYTAGTTQIATERGHHHFG